MNKRLIIGVTIYILANDERDSDSNDNLDMLSISAHWLDFDRLLLMLKLDGGSGQRHKRRVSGSYPLTSRVRIRRKRNRRLRLIPNCEVSQEERLAHVDVAKIVMAPDATNAHYVNVSSANTLTISISQKLTPIAARASLNDTINHRSRKLSASVETGEKERKIRRRCIARVTPKSVLPRHGAVDLGPVGGSSGCWEGGEEAAGVEEEWKGFGAQILPVASDGDVVDVPQRPGPVVHGKFEKGASVLGLVDEAEVERADYVFVDLQCEDGFGKLLLDGHHESWKNDFTV